VRDLLNKLQDKKRYELYQ